MEFSSSVEVEDAVEGARMTIKIILVFLQGEGVAQIQDLQILMVRLCICEVIFSSLLNGELIHFDINYK